MNTAWKALTAPLMVVLISACSSSTSRQPSATSPTAPANVAGTPGSSSVDPCVVGRWQSAAFTDGRLGTATISGGAGVHMMITNSGDLTVDYSGMQPLEIRFGSGSTGTGSLQGVAHAVIAARQGTMTPSSYDGAGVRVNAVLHTRDGVDTPVDLPLGDAFGAAVPQSYNCDRASISLIRQPPLPNLVYRRQ